MDSLRFAKFLFLIEGYAFDYNTYRLQFIVSEKAQITQNTIN